MTTLGATPPLAVTVRPLTLGDGAAFVAAVRRSRALHGEWVAPPDDRDGFAAWLARHDEHPDRQRSYALAAADGDLVGVVNVNEIVRGAFQSAYLGYYGFVPHAGTGAFTTGFVQVLDELFGPLGLHRVEANIQPGNGRSIALVRRLGFRREGYSPRYLHIAGRWRDHERWALLAEEWSGAAG